jgi:hypothetical protein
VETVSTGPARRLPLSRRSFLVAGPQLLGLAHSVAAQDVAVRLEDHITGPDAGVVIQQLLDAGVRHIRSEADCTLRTPFVIRNDDVRVALLGRVIWRGEVHQGVTAERLTGVCTVQGQVLGDEHVLPLQAAVEDGDEVIVVDQPELFEPGQHWRIRPERSEWGPLSFLVQIRAVDARTGRLTLDYRCGWAIPPGARYRFRRIRPVLNAHVEFGQLQYETRETTFSGVAGIGEQYSIDGLALVHQAEGTKYPVVLRRWCIGGRSSVGDLRDPQDVLTGGMGYGIHLIHCLRSHVEQTRTTRARHVFDWSGCAFCTADDMHDLQQSGQLSSFSCHQAFDHDNVLSHFSGWLSWANDPVFGRSMKRMTARQGRVIGQLLTFHHSPDCVFEDLAVQGDVILNVDGLRMARVIQAGGTTRWIQSSHASARPAAEIIDCVLIPWRQGNWMPASLTTRLQFIRTRTAP